MQNQSKIYEAKGLLELIFLGYCCVTLLFDLFSRLIKIFLMGQMMLMRYKFSPEFRASCKTANAWILGKIGGI